LASEVFETEVVRLLDGEEVELRPLAIAKLRKFTRTWSAHIRTMTEIAEKGRDDEGFDEDKLADMQYDCFIKLSSYGLEDQLKGERTDKQFLAHLEEVLDEHTIYKVLEVTGGLKLGDNPNQQSPSTIQADDGTTI
jgi:hypothetical protein